MSFYSESNHLTWLAAALIERRNKIAVLLRRLTGFGTRGSMNRSAFRKFLNMLDQVAVEREKEVRILNRIEAVEQEHHFRLAHNCLETVPTEDAENTQPEYAGEPMAPRPRNELLWLVVLWHLFGCTAINQKKQGLTAD